MAVEGKGRKKQQLRRETDSGKNGKTKNGKQNGKEELLAELSNFDEDGMKEFMLWKQARESNGTKFKFGAKNSVDPAPPSAPRGLRKHNLPKKRKTMPKDEGIDADKVQHVPGRTISPDTMNRHAARAHTHTRTRTHAHNARSRRMNILTCAHGPYMYLLTCGESGFQDTTGDGLDKERLGFVWKLPSTAGKRASQKLKTEEGSTPRVDQFL